MDLKEFLKPDKEKIMMSVALIIISIIFMIFGIYFTMFHSSAYLWFLPGIFLIMIYYFYLPVILSMDIVYIMVPRYDMDTMTASQLSFHFGSMFVLGCFYVYFISCTILFVRRKRRETKTNSLTLTMA